MRNHLSMDKNDRNAIEPFAPTSPAQKINKKRVW